jgi:DNA-binding NtrC family response regulator
MCDVLAETYEVALARSVADARRELARGRFDVVLCDVSLPDGTAADVGDALRAPGYPATPIVYVTGGSVEAARAVLTGDEPVLEKPFDVDDLPALVARILAG